MRIGIRFIDLLPVFSAFSAFSAVQALYYSLNRGERGGEPSLLAVSC
jgi:hypothetical protein